jgi:hypothetical protein
MMTKDHVDNNHRRVEFPLSSCYCPVRYVGHIGYTLFRIHLFKFVLQEFGDKP